MSKRFGDVESSCNGKKSLEERLNAHPLLRDRMEMLLRVVENAAGDVEKADGRGRVFDNIFIERLWRTVKYEEVYINDYQTVREAVSGLSNYFEFYNNERPHQSLNKRTPAEVYFGR